MGEAYFWLRSSFQTTIHRSFIPRFRRFNRQFSSFWTTIKNRSFNRWYKRRYKRWFFSPCTLRIMYILKILSFLTIFNKACTKRGDFKRFSDSFRVIYIWSRAKIILPLNLSPQNTHTSTYRSSVSSKLAPSVKKRRQLVVFVGLVPTQITFAGYIIVIFCV